jgi:oligopeptidase B
MPQLHATAPEAKKAPYVFEKHGRSFIDEYAWLQQKDDSQVIAYLEAENAYARAELQHLAPLQEQIVQELRGRIQKDESSAPARRGDYFYYWRMQPGQQYRLFCRKHGSLNTDGNRLLLLTNMDAGHSGASGRYETLRETAEEYAFLIDTLGAPYEPLD